jgi:predicted amidophosphoribosyltransferase
MRDAVLALKFESVSALAPVMGERMASVLAEWSPDVRAVVPVPLWGARKRERGFDQAEMLAREVSKRSGLPLVTGALVRVRDTQPQAQARLDEESRRRNGAVLLIDDVITTGATLDACARVLLDAGVEAAYGLTFARED